MRFQKEIQGLRALAVMAVILDHLDFELFQGGYVGVDIFFVISGYLITRLLLEELRTSGTISLRAFYKRRFRRLFPALLATCSVSVAIGFATLSSEHLTLLSASAISAFFSLANIYFWSQVGYFDLEAESKPLLHLWSLGVEEQFYLLWPIVAIVFFSESKRKRLPAAIALISLASFGLNSLYLGTSFPERFSEFNGLTEKLSSAASSAFYLMPFRIFEFGIGAILSLVQLKTAPRRSYTTDLLFLLGLSFIAYSVIQFSDNTIFPYYNGLSVALATAIVIATIPQSRIGRFFLGNKAAVAVGTVSYSLYLVHWPVIVYYKYFFGKIGTFDLMALTALIAGASAALYFFIEKPFRYGLLQYGRSGASGSAAVRIGATALVFALMGLVWFAPQVAGRVPEYRSTHSNAEWRRIERTTYCSSTVPGYPNDLFTCQFNRGSAKTIVLWGDSHALHLVAGFAETFQDFNIVVAYMAGCNPQRGFFGDHRSTSRVNATSKCDQRNARFLEWAKGFQDSVTIFLSGTKRFAPTDVSAASNFLTDILIRAGHDAWVLGDYVRPGMDLASCRAVPDWFLGEEWLDRRCVPDSTVVEDELRYAAEMKALTSRYIPLHEAQCQSGVCRYADSGKRITFRDSHHLSIEGAVFEIRSAKSLILSHVKSLEIDTQR